MAIEAGRMNRCLCLDWRDSLFVSVRNAPKEKIVEVSSDVLTFVVQDVPPNVCALASTTGDIGPEPVLGIRVVPDCSRQLYQYLLCNSGSLRLNCAPKILNYALKSMLTIRSLEANKSTVYCFSTAHIRPARR